MEGGAIPATDPRSAARHQLHDTEIDGLSRSDALRLSGRKTIFACACIMEQTIDCS